MDSNGKFLIQEFSKEVKLSSNMIGYIEGSNKSNKQILIHVGTNDLQKYGEETFREKYEEIIEAVVQKVKNTKVYISALLLRGDEHNYKIHIANKMLDSLCNKYNIGFIQRIDLTCMITNTYRTIYITFPSCQAIFHQHQSMVSMHLSSFAMPVVAQIILIF